MTFYIDYAQSVPVSLFGIGSGSCTAKGLALAPVSRNSKTDDNDYVKSIVNIEVSNAKTFNNC